MNIVLAGEAYWNANTGDSPTWGIFEGESESCKTEEKSDSNKKGGDDFSPPPFYQVLFTVLELPQ